MLILGIETSSREATIALLRGDAEAKAAALPQTIELACLGEARASEVLVPGIAALLERHGISKSSLSLVGVASGPGSFTGLRVAIATAKGLAEAFALPVVAVSVLEALTLAAGVEGQVLAALDAQRGELFFGEYLVARAADVPSGELGTGGDQSAQRVREGIAAMADFIAEQRDRAQAPVRLITPDQAVAQRLREAGFESAVVARPGAEEIARIAWAKFLAGERADVATLDANYLRRSDAEIGYSRKPGGG